MKTQKTLAIAALFAALSTTAIAQNVDIKDAWVRTSVQGQQATGAFMKITARDNTRLVSASTPVAGVTEVHEMKMEGDIMRMRVVVGGLELPAGKTVELKPGGYHVMFIGLKAPLKAGDKFPMTLKFEKAGVVTVEVSVEAPGAERGMKH